MSDGLVQTQKSASTASPTNPAHACGDTANIFEHTPGPEHLIGPVDEAWLRNAPPLLVRGDGGRRVAHHRAEVLPFEARRRTESFN